MTEEELLEAPVVPKVNIKGAKFLKCNSSPYFVYFSHCTATEKPAVVKPVTSPKTVEKEESKKPVEKAEAKKVSLFLSHLVVELFNLFPFSCLVFCFCCRRPL
jgi:hypothetical protein